MGGGRHGVVAGGGSLEVARLGWVTGMVSLRGFNLRMQSPPKDALHSRAKPKKNK
jgi:hypothetical protein